jgi:hypothetical protein
LEIEILNLADLFLRYKFLDISAGEFIDKYLFQKNYERIYVGSYFCQNYFCGGAEEIIASAVRRGLKITIVVPVFSDLKSGWQTAEKLLAEADEICVNDYGALERAKNLGREIVLGRLFFKESRDPRYPEIKNLSFTLNAGALKLIEDYGIKRIEIDGAENFFIPDKFKKPVEIASHFPLAYITYGQICLFASINRECEKKFRSRVPCAFQCMRSKIFYPDGNFTRIGKAVFFNAPKAENFRRVFWPELEVGS